MLAVGGGGCLTRDANKGYGDEGGRQVTATKAMAMATVTEMATAMATMMIWVLAVAMRLAGDKEGTSKGGKGDEEGEDGKAMAMVTRMAGKWTATARKRGIVTAMRVAGKQRQRRQRGRR